MQTICPGFDMARAWDRASTCYLSLRGEECSAIAYGALAPDEAELRLLGDLRGVRVLDVGCGGGHNAVVCAAAGAEVTALDLSTRQLAAARDLAARRGQQVRFLHADISRAGDVIGSDYNLILATQVLAYVDDLSAALAVCHRALAAGGRLVASLDHPLRHCFMDLDAGDLASVPLRSYFDHAPLVWHFDDGAPMKARALPLGEWLDAFAQAGLRLQRLLEPATPAALADELWPHDSALAPLRLIPHTVICILAK